MESLTVSVEQNLVEFVFFICMFLKIVCPKCWVTGIQIVEWDFLPKKLGKSCLLLVETVTSNKILHNLKKENLDNSLSKIFKVENLHAKVVEVDVEVDTLVKVVVM